MLPSSGNHRMTATPPHLGTAPGKELTVGWARTTLLSLFNQVQLKGLRARVVETSWLKPQTGPAQGWGKSGLRPTGINFKQVQLKELGQGWFVNSWLKHHRNTN